MSEFTLGDFDLDTKEGQRKALLTLRTVLSGMEALGQTEIPIPTRVLRDIAEKALALVEAQP